MALEQQETHLSFESCSGVHSLAVKILVLQLPYRNPLCLLHALQQHQHGILLCGKSRKFLPQQRLIQTVLQQLPPGSRQNLLLFEQSCRCFPLLHQ